MIEHLHEKFDHKTKKIVGEIPKISRQPIRQRFWNSLNYFIPLYNLYRIIKSRKDIIKLKKFGKPDFFSNSIFQKP